MAVATERSARQLMQTSHDDADTAAAPAAPVSAGSSARPRWVAPVAVVLVLVLLASLVAGIWFGIKAVHGFSVERSRDHALEAAKVVATRLTTYDSGTADADLKSLLATASPLYAGSLQGDQGGVIRSMRANQARSDGTVTDAGVLSYDPDTKTAHVLVSVRAKVANKAVPGGQDRDYRMEITMIDQGDWLADGVEFVS